LKFNIHVEPGYLWAKVSDRKTFEEYRAFYDAVIAESEATGINRILVDTDESTPHLKSWVLEVANTFPRTPQRRIAGLYRNEAVYRNNARYVETVAVNRGIAVMNFCTLGEAFKWLLGSS
jgi:hypothetical protein